MRFFATMPVFADMPRRLARLSAGRPHPAPATGSAVRRLGGAILAAALALCAGPGLANDGPIDLTGGGAAAPASAEPAETAALGPMSAQQIVTRANAYFNGMRSFSGAFVQVNEDGRRYPGKLMVERPGKMRFDYDPPARLLIVSDGSTVAVIDERLKTKDRYGIDQTPLKFLVQDEISLARDLKLIRARADEDIATLLLEDRATFGGTSRIRLVFDRERFELREWTVTDAQGVKTTVRLQNVKSGMDIADKNFRIGSEDLLLKLQNTD
jgi:outer membrane lipoprotein-sorting protein